MRSVHVILSHVALSPTSGDVSARRRLIRSSFPSNQMLRGGEVLNFEGGRGAKVEEPRDSRRLVWLMGKERLVFWDGLEETELYDAAIP